MDSSALLTLQSAQTSAGIGAQTSATSALHARATDPKKLGLDFESMCLSQLISPMFEGLSSDGPFGGGEGEEAMKSFYIDAIGKEMALHGGVGISSLMQKELLKLQGAN
jgi:Rod binding domain-containing protein